MKSLASAFLIALVLLNTSMMAFEVQPARANAIAVPDDYSTIQEAINAATDGDTVFVRNGTYFENVVVNKTVELIGESACSTIIDGGCTDGSHVVRVTADNVKIMGFNIRNSGRQFDCGGICIDASSKCNVTQNQLTGNIDGIIISYAANSIIVRNNLTSNLWEGIKINVSSNNTISSNIIMTTKGDGIHLEASSNNTVSNNNIVNNTIGGIRMCNSVCNTISKNNITTDSSSVNSFGMWFIKSSRNDVDGNAFLSCGMIIDDSYENVVENNSVNNKPLAYLEGISNYEVKNAGQVVAVNCTGIRVNNLNLSYATVGLEFLKTNASEIQNNSITSNNFCGVIVEYSSNNDISGNNITKNSNAIRLGWFGGSSTNNTISRNNVKNNTYGIYLGYSSDNNIISSNEIMNSLWDGICIYSSNSNVISGNSMTNNTPGIYLTSSNDNWIIQNNFNNGWQAGISDSTSIWDNGCEGNYWTNYNGLDLDPDGIGDTEYIIDADNVDHHPLMGLFSDFNATSEHHVQTVCNSTITDFQFDGTAISFNVTGEAGTAGFCRICIPAALMNDTFRVFVNGTEILPPPAPLPCSNSTHSYLYFNYSLSAKEIVIIYELPSLLILPLFMIATLLAAIVCRRERQF